MAVKIFALPLLMPAVFVATFHDAVGQSFIPTPQPALVGVECTRGPSGTTVTHKQPGINDCNGWGYTSLSACFDYCYSNALPSGCPRPLGYQCSTVIYTSFPAANWGPGFCHLSDSSCVLGAPTTSTDARVHYLFRNVISPTSAPTLRPSTSQPTTPPTSVQPTSAPTSHPTPHICNTQLHGCDLVTTYCVATPAFRRDTCARVGKATCPQL